MITPLQAIQPAINAVLNLQPLHPVEPPIAQADRIQDRLRELRIEREQYRQLLDTCERLILQYERMIVPF